MKKLKKPIALFLSVLLLLSVMPLTVFADETGQTAETANVSNEASEPAFDVFVEPETTAIPEPGSEPEAAATPEPSSAPEATATPEPVEDPYVAEFAVIESEIGAAHAWPVPECFTVTQEYSDSHPAWDIGADI